MCTSGNVCENSPINVYCKLTVNCNAESIKLFSMCTFHKIVEVSRTDIKTLIPISVLCVSITVCPSFDKKKRTETVKRLRFLSLFAFFNKQKSVMGIRRAQYKGTFPYSLNPYPHFHLKGSSKWEPAIKKSIQTQTFSEVPPGHYLLNFINILPSHSKSRKKYLVREFCTSTLFFSWPKGWASLSCLESRF